ncbi:hypothetical protein [Dietzia kunjamensis]|uniref:hypothetical protein n=1 Tax=Dietzia kunjamensis TaxID=322509 RepID=UPI0039BD23FF
MTTPNPASMPPARPTPPDRAPVPEKRAEWHARRRHQARWYPSGARHGSSTEVTVTVGGSVRRPFIRLSIDGVGSVTFKPGAAFALAAHLARTSNSARDASKKAPR